MARIFDLDNPFFSAVNKILSVIGLNFLWLALCVPVVTAGASCTAFYYTIQKNIKNSRGYMLSDFMKSFKENFKQATGIWMILLAVLTVISLDLAAVKTLIHQERIPEGTQYFFYILMILIGVYAIWTFACLARFENTVRQTMKNAALLMISSLPVSLAVFLLAAGAALIIWLMPVAVLVMPATALWLASVLLEKVFRKGMSDEDRREEDARNLVYHDDYTEGKKSGSGQLQYSEKEQINTGESGKPVPTRPVWRNGKYE